MKDLHFASAEFHDSYMRRDPGCAGLTLNEESAVQRIFAAVDQIRSEAVSPSGAAEAS
jgi:hypothetical protein